DRRAGRPASRPWDVRPRGSVPLGLDHPQCAANYSISFQETKEEKSGRQASSVNPFPAESSVLSITNLDDLAAPTSILFALGQVHRFQLALDFLKRVSAVVSQHKESDTMRLTSLVSPRVLGQEEHASLRAAWWMFLIMGIVSIVVGFLAISSAF